MPQPSDAAKRRIAQALMVEKKYGPSRADEKNHKKGKTTIRPKKIGGNWGLEWKQTF